MEPQPSPTDEVKEPKAPPSDQDEQGTFSESLEDKPAVSDMLMTSTIHHITIILVAVIFLP